MRQEAKMNKKNNIFFVSPGGLIITKIYTNGIYGIFLILSYVKFYGEDDALC